MRIHKYCVCKDLPIVKSSMEILIIRHHKEARRPSNTARIAALCLPKAQIVDFPFEDSSIIIDPSQDLLIYPAETTTCRQVNQQTSFKRLIFLDGTWRQTRKMYRKISGLQSVAWTTLEPHHNPPPKVRKPPFVGGMSTMEAIGRALGQFEGDDKEMKLYEGLSLWIDAVRQNTGITAELTSGEDFTDVRKRTSSSAQNLIEQSKQE